MIGTSIPTTAFAAEQSSGLCAHHTAHDSECGYSEAAQEHECTHMHDTSCGYQEAHDCNHVCGEECAEGCIHTHSGDCGYQEAYACNHIHNDACGYSEGSAGSPCTYTCTECNGSASEGDGGNSNDNENNSPANEGDNNNTCICTEACTQEFVNEDCPVCKVVGADISLCKGEKQDTDDNKKDDLKGNTAADNADAKDDDADSGICTCTEACIKESVNEDCPVCKVVGADISLCKGEKQNTDDNKKDDLKGNTAADNADAKDDDADSGICICTEACTKESINEDCPVCKVVGADISLCKGEKQDADDNKKGEAEEGEAEAGSRTITAWEWVDEEENLDPESGALVLSADEENPCAFGEVEELLPKQIIAEVMETPSLFYSYQTPNKNDAEDVENTEVTENTENTENTEDTPGTTEETIDLGNWECESYPEEGAFRGTYTFKATLPEGYVLSEDAAELEVEVKFDTPQVLDTAAGYDDKGFCTAYEWVNGTLTKKADETCSHSDGNECSNGYQPAVQITESNASEYGITGDNVTKYDGYYAITNAGQLYWFADYVNIGEDTNKKANAVLTKDITVNSSLLSEDGTLKGGTNIRNWVPIGYNTYNYSTFQGKFDGQNHTVSGIYCSLPEESNGVGLFGRLDKGGTISNVILADSYFKGKEYVGGICGQIGEYGGTIEYCTNKATVTGTENLVGGICGSNNTLNNYSSTISNCTNSGKISGAVCVGGICGDFRNGTMRDCMNSESVTGSGNSVGGICGSFAQNSTVSDCRNSGSISGKKAVGGICGANDNSTGKISGCNNSGSVTGTATSGDICIGGICGDNMGIITNCNNLTDGAVSVNSNVNYVGGVCGRNYNKLDGCTNAATVTGKQQVGGICGYNVVDISIASEALIQNCTNQGQVTVYETENTSVAFSQIGGVCGENENGKITGSTNKGIVCVSTADDVGGICGKNEGTVTGSKNEGGAVSGKNNVGGICGTNTKSNSSDIEFKIDNCTNSGDVTGSKSNVGGICGSNTGPAKIINSTNETTGVINGTSYVGGICGNNSGSAEESIKGCENKGSVTGTGEKVGGVCGVHTGSGAIVSSRNVNATVSGKEKVGGICGEVGSSAANISIKDCESSGSVTGTGSYVGGICGVSAKGLTGSRNSATVSGTEYVGGICGKLGGTGTDISIDDCQNEGAVTGTKTGDANIGGICGYSDAGNITNSSNAASVTGSGANRIGGICGYIQKGKLSDCQNQGDVTGKNRVGGIFGYTAGDGNLEFSSCTNSGNIKGAVSVGGIGGSDENGITICNSSNSGTIVGTENVGGICGYAYYTTIKYSYNTESVRGQEDVGGIAGTAGIINHVYNTGSVTGAGTSTTDIGEISGTAQADNLSDCYYLDTIKTGQLHANDTKIYSMTKEQFESGRVAYLLNDSLSSSPTWYQWIDANGKTADASPVLDSTHGVVYSCTPCTSAYSNTSGQTKEHSNFKPCESTDTDASSKHICGLCGEKVAHSGVVYKADTTSKDTILAYCSCEYNYGSIKIKAPDSLIYDGNAKGATIYTTGLVVVQGGVTLPSDSDVAYKKVDNETETSLTGQPTDAGTYKATLSLTGDDNIPVTASVTYTIAQAAPTVTWDRTECTAYYTGNAISSSKLPSLIIKGVGGTDITDDYDTADYTFSYRTYQPNIGGIGSGAGGSMLPATASFENGLPTEIGEYEIKATVKAKENYTGAEVTETTGYLILEVKYLDTAPDAALTNQYGATLTGSDWWAQSVNFTAPDGFTISQELGGSYGDSFTYEAETGASGKDVTYYLKNSNGEIAPKEVKVYIDRTAPTFPESGDYGIQIKENWFKSLLNKITFGRAYKNNVEVKVLAKEELSGVEKYYYYIDNSGSEKVKTTSELDDLYESNKMGYEDANDSNAVLLTTLANTSDTKNYVVYAYAVDKAGNKSEYICSNGVVVDDKAPMISVSTPAKAHATLRDTGADITINASEAGMYFYVYGKKGTINVNDFTDITKFATGTDANGRTTWAAKNGIESGTMVAGNNTFSLTGLERNNEYSLYAIAVDEAGNASDMQNCNFTTLKAMPMITELPKISGTYGQKLSEMTVTDGKATYDDAEVAGTWAVSTGDEGEYPIVNDPDTYEVIFTPDSEQYESITVEVSPTVAKKPITVTVKNASKVYGEVNPAFDFEITSGELVSVYDTSKEALGITLSCEAGQYSDVKADGYAITGTSNSANYAVTVTPGTLTIEKATPEIIVSKSSYEVTYGDAPFNLNITARNMDLGITDTNLAGNVEYEVTDGDGLIAVSEDGTVTIKSAKTANAVIKVTLPESTNYKEAESKTIYITIAKKAYGTGSDDITKKYLYSRDNADTIDISALLPTDCGAVTYTVTAKEGSYKVEPAVDTDGNLTYAVSAGSKGDTGKIVIKAKTDNYKDITITVSWELTDQIPVVLKEGSSVTLKNSVLTYGDTLSKLEFNEAVFVSKDDPTKEIAGTLAWTNPNDTPNMGTSSAEWTFTPDNPEYEPISGRLDITVNKAAPTIETAPAVDMIYNPNTNLSGIDLNTAGTTVTAGIVKGTDGGLLSGAWSWGDSSQVPQADNNGYEAIFTPADATHYAPVKHTITVTVAKATPYIDSTLTASGLTYGQSLAASTLQGSAYYDSTTGTPVAGSFEWKNKSLVPAVSDSNSTSYEVIFKPTDSTNYDEAKITITVMVKKAAYPSDRPSDTMSVANSCKTVGSAPLPNGWVWKNTDKDKALEVGVPVTVTAVYEGEDKDNYEETGLKTEVTITRSAASGSSGEDSGNNNNNSTNTGTGSSSSSNEDTTNLSPVNGSSTIASTPAPVQSPLIPESRPSGEKTDPVYEPIGTESETAESEGNTDGRNKVPFIKGENGKEGWDVIRTETENTPEGSTVTVDMNGAVAVPKEVLEDIRGRDVTLVFDMGNGITWSVNGQSITGDVTGDIDFGVTMGAQAGRSIPVDVINNVTGERTSLNLTLAYEGEFGFTAVLTVNMNAENAGLYANLFYYNPSTGELEFICCDEIAADGTTELTFTHASDYTIVIDTDPMDGSAKGDDAVKDSGSDSGSGSGNADGSSVAVATDAEPVWSPLWIILIGAVVIVIGIGGVLIAKRKRNNE